jgi:hypothetical protein
MHPPDFKDKSAIFFTNGGCNAPFVSQHILRIWFAITMNFTMFDLTRPANSYK